MHSAPRSAASTRAWSTKPGTAIASSSPCSRTSASTRPRSGPSPKISARSSGASALAAAIAGTSAGTRFSGMWRPANTTMLRVDIRLDWSLSFAARVLALEHRHLAADALAPQPRSACRREKQNARCGRRAQARCTRQPAQPPARPR